MPGIWTMFCCSIQNNWLKNSGSPYPYQPIIMMATKKPEAFQLARCFIVVVVLFVATQSVACFFVDVQRSWLLRQIL
jgi:hypothetical protein